MVDGSEWMTIPELAAALGVSRSTVRYWIRRRELPGERYKDPHEKGLPRYRVRRTDVRAFAELHYLGKPRPPWLDAPDA
jgi:excisionase family DNA binding protein